nr:ectoine hydroxylase [Rhabdothermincola salaria]
MPRQEPVVWGDRDAGPLSTAQVDAYEKDGFLAFDALVEPADLATIEHEIAQLLATVPGDDERIIREHGGDTVRSIFEVHKLSKVFADLAADPRLAGPARQILGSDIYLHQSRLNLKPGFRGKEFYWHSDFETWHAEDGMPRMRAVSLSLSLTRNEPWNGSLMVIPGSHREFVGCAGETPADHYRSSLRAQEYGVPSEEVLARLVDQGGIETITGPPGSAVYFDCNVMHGSNGNITPLPRTNVFFVYNSVENAVVEPFAAPAPRPEFIGARTFEPL